MRTVPTGLAAHLQGAATTTCHAWRLTRRDGTVFGFTEHDRDLTFDGTLFAAVSGFQAGEVETGLGLSSDAAQVLGAFSAQAITRDDLAAGRYDGALVETFITNWRAPADFMKLSTRELGEVRAGPDVFHAELRSLAARLNRPQGRIYARNCDAELGDHRCKLVLDDPAFMTTDTVIEAESNTTISAAGLSGFESGWFAQGRILFTSGTLAGLEFAIADHRVEQAVAFLTLWQPMEINPDPGDAFTITAGCNKQHDTCRLKFANLVNFQGFPFMPGSDFAYGYADGDTTHDGRPIIS